VAEHEAGEYAPHLAHGHEPAWEALDTEPPEGGAPRMNLHLPLRRTLAGLLLPFSLAPVVLFAPSMLRAPVVLWHNTARALAPAHPQPRPKPTFAAHYLIGPSRLEIDALEESAGPFTPRAGVSPLAEPAWAARAGEAATGVAADPVQVYREVEADAAHPAVSSRQTHTVAAQPALARVRALRTPSARRPR
jgi:hypothetical protein